MNFLRRHILLWVVFLTGAAVLVVEVAAVRILSPFYGNTIYTVSSVISIILAALSLGYYVGGRTADRLPSLTRFFGIIFAGGVSVLLLQLFSLTLLPELARLLSLIWGPLISAVVLFFVPGFLLGMLSPFAIKLQELRLPEAGIGRISGDVFFWSTFGSISGSLLTGFVFIPRFGVSQIMLTCGVFLILMGIVGMAVSSRRRPVLARAVALAVAATGLDLWVLRVTSKADVLYSRDGVYEKITIYDTERDGRPVRYLKQDRSLSGAIYLDSDELVVESTKYYALYPLFTPQVRRALVIGGGASSIPKALLDELPEVRVDLAEIEASLFELGRRYFGVPADPRLVEYVRDGRRLLYEVPEPYDLIYSDVYRSFLSIPSHFTTREFFALARQKLNPDGLFLANIIGQVTRETPSLILSEMKTFRSVFPNSYYFATRSAASVESQNVIFVGYHSERPVRFDTSEVLQSPNPLLAGLHHRQVHPERFELSAYLELTDDHAPIDYLTAHVLKRRTDLAPERFEGKLAQALIDQQRRYGPRSPGSDGHRRLQAFLKAELATLCHSLHVRTPDASGASDDVSHGPSIVGRLHPQRQHRVLIATNYAQPPTTREADADPRVPTLLRADPAAAVAVALEAARFLANTPEDPRIGVDFAFLDTAPTTDNQEAFGSLEASAQLGDDLRQLYPDGMPTLGLFVQAGPTLWSRPVRTVASESATHRTSGHSGESAEAHPVAPDFVPHHDRRRSPTPLDGLGIPAVLCVDENSEFLGGSGSWEGRRGSERLARVGNALLHSVYAVR